ncbi:GGDEF domain-containing protein [Lentibacillus sediminis]|uniref:GGDEF domain-containing protein n=1 Tax=Lentibacillus sediminis TaxID=1940529 RepID=UPI001EFE43BC|nr:GGDEF domain-containing protein [Lentibacillus sediminis]
MRLKVFIMSLFLGSLIVAFTYDEIGIETSVYLTALLLFLFFSFLYSYMNVTVKKGNIRFDYGISYGLAFGLFTGPLGIFIFETIHRFMVYFNRKRTKTDDPDEFLHTFYNIGSFSLRYSIAYFLFVHLAPFFSEIPFGFWLLIILLVITVSLLSDTFLIGVFYLQGGIKSVNEAIDFVKSRNISDMGKEAFSNGLLLMFLQQQQWEMLIGLFVLNYLVSRSFMVKTQGLQHKIERDKFEQMAYTDFLTEVYNRTYMNKKMNELDASGEYLGMVVADIDSFKRINDTYNHTVGDTVIQHFAAKLQSYLTEDDYLFRSGGEEFTIILRDRSYETCVELLKEMQIGVKENIAKAEYEAIIVEITVTSSFGLYYSRAMEENDIKKAYVRADNLLMQSKEYKNKITAENGVVAEKDEVAAAALKY